VADFYEILGVDRRASADEIKKAYRKRARELHPDANPDDPTAEDRFKELSRAYEVLSDAESRARYDQFGEAGVGGAAGGGDPFGGGGIGDIFDAFFGGGSPFGGNRGPAGPPRGADVETVARITLEESVFGCTTSVAVRTAVACDDCGGSGAAPGTSATTCPDCRGTGQVRRVRQSILGQMVTTSTCGRCGGAGETVGTPCRACRGEGRVQQQKSYDVQVPAGVASGQTMRLSGRGAKGPRGGEAGDLYVHIEVAEHERWRREDDDLVADVEISVAQAALGVELTLPTLDGDEQLVVPAGVQHGHEFTLRGRGVPRLTQSGRSRGRGDLRARIVVVVPTKLSPTEEELLRRLAKERGEDVAPADGGIVSRIKSAFT